MGEPLVLRCVDFDAALALLTGTLGFRIDSIRPADAPAVAVVSGHGVRVRLEREGAVEPVVHAAIPELVITRGGAFHSGRAGMLYRDLIPSRLGGAFVASHIRIPDGGPVPDYVHHHDVRFQMIFCRAGWVRVVYEDQGAPFTMQAGDCVLQPPGIRHRVLESSVGLEVIEIGSPAVHDTFADHDLTLPTPTLRPERAFGGQRFVRHVAAEAGAAERIDTGISAATGGLGDVHVVCSNAGGTIALRDARELRLVYVLAGSATLRAEGLSVHVLGVDACAVVPPGLACTLELVPGATLLEVLA